MMFLQTLNSAYLNNENMLATKNIQSDNQTPYALNVCQIYRHSQTDVKVQNQVVDTGEKKNKHKGMCR